MIVGFYHFFLLVVFFHRSVWICLLNLQSSAIYSGPRACEKPQEKSDGKGFGKGGRKAKKVCGKGIHSCFFFF